MNHRLVIFLSSLLLIAVVVGGVVYVERLERPIPALGPPPAEAAPAINWTPDQMTETVPKGGQKTKVISFVSDQNLTNVAVQVVPELQPYVSATPASFTSISAGTTVTITLTLSASSETPLRTFEGTLHLKDNSGKSKKTYAKPLPVALTIVEAVALPTPVIETPIVFPDRIPANQPMVARVTVELEPRDTLISESVKLGRYDQQGNFIADLGLMYDDHTHSDLLADDGVFTTQITFNETKPSIIVLRVSTAYKGLPTRVLSEASGIFVQSTRTPEEVLDEFVNDLRSGNIESAVQALSTAKDVERIRAADPATRARLANSLATARLVEAQSELRFYAGPWTDEDGTPRDVEFFLTRNSLGEWKISF